MALPTSRLSKKRRSAYSNNSKTTLVTLPSWPYDQRMSMRRLSPGRWRLENLNGPSGLILSRQNVQDLPLEDGKSTYQAALNATHGAYVVQDTDQPDVILLASGSEVATLVEGAKLLEERDGLSIKIVSVPSEGRFRQQDKAYQESVIPSGVPIFGMTAGLPVTLQGLVGPEGKVFGLDHFGYSAPYTVLDEKFGFTGENVYKEVTAYLG